jgi:hypothetical protein
MKPITCKQIGCGGSNCNYYIPTDKYPYYECQFTIGEEEIEEEEEENDE